MQTDTFTQKCGDIYTSTLIYLCMQTYLHAKPQYRIQKSEDTRSLKNTFTHASWVWFLLYTNRSRWRACSSWVWYFTRTLAHTRTHIHTPNTLTKTHLNTYTHTHTHSQIHSLTYTSTQLAVVSGVSNTHTRTQIRYSSPACRAFETHTYTHYTHTHKQTHTNSHTNKHRSPFYCAILQHNH